MIIPSGYVHLRQYLRKKCYFLCILPILLANAPSVESLSEFGCNSQNINSLQSKACLPPEYSKFELPNPNGVNPIKVELLIQEVLSVDDKENSISFSCYYNMQWQDKRIQFSSDFGRDSGYSKAKINDPNFNLTMNPNVIVPMNPKMLEDLWVPNAMIYNLKSFEPMHVLDKLHGLWISADYTVSYSTSAHITFFCPMNYHKFPLDTQICKFQIGSYSYDDSQMTFTTFKAKFCDKSENTIPLDYAIKIRKLTPNDSILIFGLGNFSLAGFEMVLDRHASTYIFMYYLPSGLFVVASWISFLIPVNVIPGRMILLVTLFLVLVNIFNTVTTNTPKAEGPTAIAAWMFACILFVLGSFIEYAVILFKDQRYANRQNKMNNQIMSNGKFVNEAQDKGFKNESDQQLAEEYQWIDKFSLIAFPIVFFVFNMFYWLAYMI